MSIEAWELLPTGADRFLLKIRGDRVDVERIARAHPEVCLGPQEIGDPHYRWLIQLVNAPPHLRAVVERDLAALKVSAPDPTVRRQTITDELNILLVELSDVLDNLVSLTPEEHNRAMAKVLEVRERDLRENTAPRPTPLIRPPLKTTEITPSAPPAADPSSPSVLPRSLDAHPHPPVVERASAPPTHPEVAAAPAPPLSFPQPPLIATPPPLPRTPEPLAPKPPVVSPPPRPHPPHSAPTPQAAPPVLPPTETPPSLETEPTKTTTDKPPFKKFVDTVPSRPEDIEIFPLMPDRSKVAPPLPPQVKKESPMEITLDFSAFPNGVPPIFPPSKASDEGPAVEDHPPSSFIEPAPLANPSPVAPTPVSPPLPGRDLPLPSEQLVRLAIYYAQGSEGLKDRFLFSLSDIAQKKAKKPLYIQTTLSQSTPVTSELSSEWMWGAKSTQSDCFFVLVPALVNIDSFRGLLTDARQAGLPCFLIPESEVGSRLLYVDLMVELMLLKRRR